MHWGNWSSRRKSPTFGELHWQLGTYVISAKIHVRLYEELPRARIAAKARRTMGAVEYCNSLTLSCNLFSGEGGITGAIYEHT